MMRELSRAKKKLVSTVSVAGRIEMIDIAAAVGAAVVNRQRSNSRDSFGARVEATVLFTGVTLLSRTLQQLVTRQVSLTQQQHFLGSSTR